MSSSLVFSTGAKMQGGLAGLLLVMTSAVIAEEGPQAIFHAPFEEWVDAAVSRGNGKAITGSRKDKFEPGVVGNAYRGSVRWEGRGNICLDRGTLAFFFKPNREVVRHEWGGVLGVSSDMDAYWSLVARFSMIRNMFCLEFLDVGRYGERLQLKPNVGRWKTGEWLHLAMVWDRNEGLMGFEDGRLVNSSWGEQRWEWNLDPIVLWAGAFDSTLDELYVFSDCLTAEQIAQLAKGERPTGEPMPITPPEKRRAADLARMGWSDEDLAEMPRIEAGKPQMFTFAGIVRATDDKRLVAQPFEGLKATCWPLSKYAVSLGRPRRRLDITFAPRQTYDRVRIFTQRPFRGRLARFIRGVGYETLIEVEAPRPIWRGSFEKQIGYGQVSLMRENGWIGQIDFYKAEPMEGLPTSARVKTLGFLTKLRKMPATDAGRAVLGDTPARFDNPVQARTGVSAPRWSLASPAFGGFQMVSEPLATAGLYDGALVKLVVEGLAGPTPVRVVVKEPIFTQRDWLAADAVLVPNAEERQTFTLWLKGRPVANTEGIELPVLVTAAGPVTWVMGAEGTTIDLTSSRWTSRRVAIEDQIEFAREGYAETNEGHSTIWRRRPAEWPRFYTPLKWLSQYAPEERETMQLMSRLGWRKLPVPYREPKNAAGAPNWAFWQMEAIRECKRILHWLIDHRQVENGEFGGLWGDDTDMVENWIGWALSCDGDGKIKKALRIFWDGVWKECLVDGASRAVRDTLHSYEEGMGCISQQLLVDYGDPIVFQRMMRSCTHYEKWMKENEDGTLSFRSWMLGAPGVWEDGRFGVDRAGNAMMLNPAAYLYWYCRHPTAANTIKGWQLITKAGGITRDAYSRMIDDKERRQFYLDRLEHSRKYRYGAVGINSVMDELGTPGDLQKEELIKIASRFGYRKDLMSTYDMGNYAWTTILRTEHHWLGYRATEDTNVLAGSYRQACMFINNQDWLYTWAQSSTDRIPLPRTTIIRARMGALPAHRGGNNSFWPRHGISYAEGADEIAALVTKNSESELRVRFYAFPEKVHPLQARVWRLWPGTYKLTLSDDMNDDGVPEKAIDQREVEVVRGSFLELALPPRQCSVLTLSAVKNTAPTFDKPDPAISARTLSTDYGEHLQVTVHNIGSKPVENLLVRIIDGKSGKVISDKRVRRIEAPLDFKPKTAVVEYHNVNCVTYGSIIVEIDPKKEIDDLNRFNNRAVLEY